MRKLLKRFLQAEQSESHTDHFSLPKSPLMGTRASELDRGAVQKNGSWSDESCFLLNEVDGQMCVHHLPGYEEDLCNVRQVVLIDR